MPHDSHESQPSHHAAALGKYIKFFAMIGSSMVAMFLLMYTHSYQILNHAWFSETRLFMTLIMGGSMTVIMLLFMLGMYKHTPSNIGVVVLGVAMIGGGIALVRSQVTVDDSDYMQGMIPHHSIAVLTSERAQIEDVRVRELADQITEAQRREIKEMQWLIADIKKNGVAKTQAQAGARPVPAFDASPE